MATSETRRSSRLASRKQDSLVHREEETIPAPVKATRKRKKSSVIKETEVAAASSEASSETVHNSKGATVGECEKGTKTSDEPLPKRKTKVMNVKERKLLINYLDSTNDSILAAAVRDDLKQQLLADSLKSLAEVLCTREQLLATLISCHRKCFTELYVDCKKTSDPMLNFQISWYNQCSAFLLSEEHDIAVLNLKELPGCYVSNARDAWLHFCSNNSVPVPKSNPVMMTVSSTIYRVLLERVMSFQESLKATNAVATSREYTDGDDVYYRFGGAAICDMLKLHYKQIRSCSDEQRDCISQEIVVLQAINTKDKSNVPEYLKYRDQGFMYFPHVTFIPFLKAVDDCVKGVVNSNGLEENGSDLVQVSYIPKYLTLSNVNFFIGRSQNSCITFRHSRNVSSCFGTAITKFQYHF